MKYDKIDVLQLVLSPYVLAILNALKKHPKRFNDLRGYVRNGRTLSFKLSKMIEYGLIEVAPIKEEGRYHNSYALSERGKSILAKIEKI